MFCLNIQQRNRLRVAINSYVVRQVSWQLVQGYIAFIGIGGVIGWWLDASFIGLAIGFAVHTLMMMLSNDAIEETIKNRTESSLKSFAQQVQKAPKLIQDEYLKRLSELTDQEMKKWAANSFAVRISGSDILESFNES